jgi:hypothetical protein
VRNNKSNNHFTDEQTQPYRYVNNNFPIFLTFIPLNLIAIEEIIDVDLGKRNKKR